LFPFAVDEQRGAARRYGLCTLQRWVDVLRRGPPEQRAPALALLAAAFRAPGLRLGAGAAAAPAALFAPAAALLGGRLGGEALDALAAALAVAGGGPAAPPGAAPPPQWPDACEATGDDRGAGAAALGRLAAAWQPGRRPAARGRLLPFLPAPAA